MKTATATSF